ncbi:MAG: ROK family protein [Bacilli bacterium]
MKNVYIGVDVGGMTIKCGIVDKEGNILYKESIKTINPKQSYMPFLISIKELLVKTIAKAKELKCTPKGIGFGIPGVVNNKTGSIDYVCNINLFHVPLADYLKDLKIPVHLSNDANVACLAEQLFGVAKGYSSVVLLTLGTGIGGGVIIDNKLFEGNEGKGAELGHVTMVVDGEQCGCGRKGCFEAYASASALNKYTKLSMEKNKNSLMWKIAKNDIANANGYTSFEAAKKGDVAAIDVVNKYIKYLGEGILNYCNIFRPEAIVLGGGVSNQGDYLKGLLEDYCGRQFYGYRETPKVEILIAKLKNDAGIIGAAALCFND